MAASMPLSNMISLVLRVQSLGAAISSMLDPNQEWKPEVDIMFIFCAT